MARPSLGPDGPRSGRGGPRPWPGGPRWRSCRRSPAGGAGLVVLQVGPPPVRDLGQEGSDPAAPGYSRVALRRHGSGGSLRYSSVVLRRVPDAEIQTSLTGGGAALVTVQPVPGRRGGGASLRRCAVSAIAVSQGVRSRRRRSWRHAITWRVRSVVTRFTELQVDGGGGLGAAAQRHDQWG